MLLHFKLKRCTINTVSQSCGLRTVVEDVSQMSATLPAQGLDPDHAKGHVLLGLHALLVRGVVKTWPTRAGIKLMCRGEERG